MSSETDHPRQRTVAELLAEHGEGGASGRRRRRRVSDAADEGGHDAPPAQTPAGYGSAAPVERRPEPPTYREPATAYQEPTYQEPTYQEPTYQEPTYREPTYREPTYREPTYREPPYREPAAQEPAYQPAYQEPTYQEPAYREPAYREPDRSVLREPVPPAPRVTPEDSWGSPAFPAERPGPRRERPTDVMARMPVAPVEEALGRPQQGPAKQGPVQRGTPPPETPEDHDAGPSTMIGGAPVEAQNWHRVRTADARRGGTAIDGGPPLPPGPVAADDEPAGLGAPTDAEERDGLYRDGHLDDGHVDDGHYDDGHYDDGPDDAPKPRDRRLGRAAAAARDVAAPAWAAVLGQWIAGALGGAVLWVLFRYLWRNLPVVALASAVVVTVGLVVVVRALLHNDDRRTTLFAVLVGLLLTASPAILVLMGR